MFQCPACGDFMHILTKYHCEHKHNMSKTEFEKTYGKAQYKERPNNRQINQWLDSFQSVKPSDYTA